MPKYTTMLLALKKRRDALDDAINTLERFGGERRRGRPPGSTRTRGPMSAATKKKMADARRKWWASKNSAR